jgi:apolipoprotein D and lipocalin family protein
MKNLIFLFLSIFLFGCISTPEGVEPVTDFDISRYLGTWYEIARLDHSFERGLMEVTADYSFREDGGINVINRGRDMETGKWKEAVGKAYFTEDKDVGKLKVSFFGPFYGAYNIARLERDYSMALIVGPTLGYAWLLSRTREPDAALCDRYFTEATRLGISREDWILVRTCR